MRIFAEAPQDETREFMPTAVITHVRHDDGSIEETTVCLEKELEPLSVLNFEDYTIGSCLRHGISLKSLKIKPDLRLGFDDEIDRFNAMIDESSAEIFNV